MLTLGVTTSTDVVAVAVADRTQVLGSAALKADRRHAEELMPMVKSVLDAADIRMTDIGQLAVDVGPGRFTGLRVGLATVRTLALALSLEIVPVSSLELLALGCDREEVLAVIDARRGEVFQQRFSRGLPVGSAVVGDPAELAADIPDGVLALGDGADRYSEHYRDHRLGIDPSAELLVRLASNRKASPGPLVMPLYMREPDVQINIKTRAGA